MLVVSMASSGFAGTVSAEGADGHCTETEDFLFTMTNGGFGMFPECKPSRLSDKIQELKEEEQNQTALDVYNAGASLQSDSESTLAMYENYLHESEAYAWSEARAESVHAYENGTSKSSARVEAGQAIDGVYMSKQRNLIAEWNTKASQIRYLHNRATEGSELPDDTVTAVDPACQDGNCGENAQYSSSDITGFKNITYTLANGSQVDVLAIQVRDFYDEDSTLGTNYQYHNVLISPLLEGMPKGTGTNNAPQHYPRVVVQPPDGSEYDNKTMVEVNATRWRSIHNETEETRQRLRDNSDEVVNETYDAYQDGQLNASEYVGPSTMAQEYATQYNSTGYYSYAAASLASMGLETPDMTTTSVMNVSVGGATYSGLLMSQSAPGGEWKANTTYEASNISGNQFVVKTSGGIEELSGQFTVQEIQNKTGHNVDSAEIKTYNRKTADSTEYVELQQEISDLQTEIESQNPGGGGNGGDGFPPKEKAIGLVALVLLVALVGGANQRR